MRKSLFILFSAVILILGMLIILSSYQKVQMAGVFAKDQDEDLPLCEIVEDENELNSGVFMIDNETNPQDDNKPICPKSDLQGPEKKDKHHNCPDGCKDPHDGVIPDKSECKDKEKKQERKYKHKKRHRFFDSGQDDVHINEYFFEQSDNQDALYNIPFKSIRPDLKRKNPRTSHGGRKSPPRTLPIPIKDNIGYMSTFSDDYNVLKPKTLQTAFGNVISKDTVNKLVVKGEPVSGQYYDNIIIEIYGMDDVLINTIRPKTNSGYGANILLEDFEGSGIDQIFLGINSGGSGGFGYFYVFDASNNEIKTIFDYEEFSQKNKYTGRYLDYYRAEVVKADSDVSYIIDLSGRPKDYLDILWGADGKLLTPKSLTISDVNTVFPYYNYTTQLFELMIFQRVTGLYNADGLGYIVSQQNYKDGGFVTFYETMEIFPQ